MSDTVLISASEGVATITLNRPEALNSLTTELKESLLDALLQVAADPAARFQLPSERTVTMGSDVEI